MIIKLELENFTVFGEKQTLNLSKGINIILGENGTGKSHLLKLLYSISNAVSTGITETNKDITDALSNNFMPIDNKIHKLRATGADSPCEIKLSFDNNQEVEFSFNINSQNIKLHSNDDIEYDKEPVFIPTKEVLSMMEGFVSLFKKYHLSFDRTYYDLCSKLDLPKFREENIEEKSKWIMEELEKIIGGKFIFHGGGRITFKSKSEEYSVNVMAEGFRKAGMLYRLLETGVINPGTSGSLFWDEPEANMNPKLMEKLVEILLELARNGQQIILATHDYVLLKWFDLLSDSKKGDHINYVTLDRQGSDVTITSTDEYLNIKNNAISDTFSNITDVQIKKSTVGIGN